MKRSKKKSITPVLTMLTLLFTPQKAFAQQQGEALQIGNFDSLLWSVIKTIQMYTVPIGALVLAGLGVKMMISGDDTRAKESAKNTMIKVAVGMAIVFGATTISQLLKNTVS